MSDINDSDDDSMDLEATLKPYKDAILTLAQQLEDVRGQVSNLNDLLVNQVIGGIKNLHDASVREDGINSLKTKYGSQVAPLEGVLPELGVNDWAGELHDHLQQMASTTPNWNDEMEANHVGGIIKGLQDKVGRIASASGAKPVAESVSVEKVPAEAAPEAPAAPDASDDDEELPPEDLIQTLKSLKQRGSKHLNN